MKGLVFKTLWKIKRFIALFRGFIIPLKRHGDGEVFIESLCEIKNPHWVSVGGNNLFQRGSVILADSPNSIFIGKESCICRYSVVQSVGGFIRIGNRTQIGDFCNLYGQGGLTIGNDVMIASCVQVVPNQHTYNDLSRTIRENPEKSYGIVIEDDVWIGTNVAILDGVKIGRGAIIGAGSVVSRDVAAFSIVAGVPAREIKRRDKSKESIKGQR